MPTITTVDAAWTPAPIEFTDAEARRFDTAMFLGDGSNNGVRGGIVRHGDNSLAVSVNGTDQVTVQAGAFVIPAATGLGVYRGALSAATAATALAARNGTNPRIDLIVIEATSSGAVVKTIEGTPGASPSAPALPAQHIELARVTVPAVGPGAVTVDSSWRAYAAGLGGTLYVPQANRLPGSGNQKGQRAVALDTGISHTWNGTAWTPDYVRAESTLTANFVLSASAQTLVPFDGEVEDSHNAMSAGTFTCPAAGLYRVDAHLAFENRAAGRRGLFIRRNSSATAGLIQTNAVADDVTYLTSSVELRCGVGDVLYVHGLQTSATAMFVHAGSTLAVRKVA